MTAAFDGRAHRRADAPTPRPSWSMISWVTGVVAAGVTAVSGYASLRSDVVRLKQEIPPGSLQRLDERTLQMQKTLERLEARP